MYIDCSLIFKQPHTATEKINIQLSATDEILRRHANN